MASRAFSYILFFSFHLYIIHAHLPKSSANFSIPLKFLDELNGVRKGNHREGVDKLKKHLAHLGYMITCPRNFIKNKSKNTVDKCLELALKKYQKFYHLKITGVLDDATIKKMRQPRCGMPDFYPAKKNKTAFHEHFTLSGFPPLKTNKLTYDFKDVKEEYIPPMEHALRKLETATHFNFTRTKTYKGAMLRFSFQPPFTGELERALAYTIDTDGEIHINKGKTWSATGAANAYDIGSVFLHEMGHALGLGHSEVREASMYAYFQVGEVRGLHQDDIDGLKDLYHF